MEEVKDLVCTFKKWDVEILWDLTMRCNYSCSYCESYDNNVPLDFKSVDEYKAAIVNLSNLYKNKKIQLGFLGGEPTLFKQWPSLIKHCIENNIIPIITTNLSPSLKYFRKHAEILKNSNSIMVSWHPSFVKNHDEMIEKILYLDSIGSIHNVSILGDTRYWDRVKKAVNDLQGIKDKIQIGQIYNENTGNFSTRDSKWYMTEEQNKLMFSLKPKTWGDIEVFINGKKTEDGIKSLQKHNLLNFKGLYCAIGKKRLTIFPNGDCYPSVCLMKYKKACLGNIFENTVKLPKKPIICPFSFCACGPDIRIEKHKKLEDFND